MIAPAEAREAAAGTQRAPTLLERLWWLPALALGALAFREIGGHELIGDARFLIRDNRQIDGLTSLWANVTHDYFWSSSGGIIPYWRPVTKASWVLEHAVFGSFAGGYHLVNLLLHLVAVAGIQLLARAIGLGRGLALTAGVLFALHPVAVEPVSLAMARSDVGAAAGLVWAVLSWVWLCQTPRRRAALLALHLGAVVLALGSKESALVLPVVLATWAVAAGDLAPGQRRRLAWLLPAALASGLYWAARIAVLERVAAGLSRTDFGLHGLRIATSLAEYASALFPLALESTTRHVSTTEAASGASLAWSLARLGLLAGAAVGLSRSRDRTGAVLLAWAVLAVTPVIVTEGIHVPAVEEKLPLADRWAYAALAPVSLLAPWVYARLAESAPFTRLAQRARIAEAGALLVAAWAMFQLAVSAPVRREFRDELGMLANEDRVFFEAVPERFRTDEDHCRSEQRKLARASLLGRPDQVLELLPAARGRCGDSRDFWNQELQAFLSLGRLADALPSVKRLLELASDPTTRAVLADTASRSSFAAGQPHEAARYASEARQLGLATCGQELVLAEGARAEGQAERAATHLSSAYRCGEERDPSLLIAAATLLIERGLRDRAEPLMARARQHRLSPDQAAQLEAISSSSATQATPLAPP